MKKAGRNISLAGLVLAVLVLVCIAGCSNTWQGIQKDCKALADWDKDFQEKYW